MFKVIAPAVALMMYACEVSAFCSEPSMYSSPPSAPGFYSKPDAPFCLSGYSYSGTHTCDSWEIDSYINEINDYIRQLNHYADEANSFARSAINFANEAADYARCEANDVKSEIE